MNRTMKTRISAVIMALMMTVSISASAYADGPQGNMEKNSMHTQRQMGDNGPAGKDQSGPKNDFGQNKQENDRQADRAQNGMGRGTKQSGDNQNGHQPPEIPNGKENLTPPADYGKGFGQNDVMNSQQPPEKPEGEENITPPEKPEEALNLPNDEQDLFRLFRLFMEWLKTNGEE